METKQIREPVTVEESEAVPPDSVKNFFKKVYTGNV